MMMDEASRLSSDDDSISTTSTILDAEFVVTEVIGERTNLDESGRKIKEYLTRWEGYEDKDCTWQPRNSFHSPTAINEWLRRKQREKNGEVQAVDIPNIIRLMELEELAREDRRRRRAAKRTRIARRKSKRTSPPRSRPRNTTSANEVISLKRDLSDNEDSGDDSESSPRKKGRLPSRRRRSFVISESDSDDAIIQAPKGLGSIPLRNSQASQDGNQKSEDIQPLHENNTVVIATVIEPPVATMASSTPHVDLEMDHDSDGSLFGNGSAIEDPNTECVDREVPNLPSPRHSHASSTMSATAVPTSGAASSQNGRLVKSIATKSSRGKIFMTNDPTAKRRERVRVSGSTAANPTGKPFTKLSKQGRYQSYGKNEPIPDPTKLTFLDASTGRAAHTSNVILENHVRDHVLPGYLPTSEPPQAAVDKPVETGSYMVSEPEVEYSPDEAPPREPTNPVWVKQNVTCRHWYKDRWCRFGDACKFAHAQYSDVQPKTGETCKSWSKKGKCAYPDNVCEYWHAFKDPKTGLFSIGHSGDTRSQKGHEFRVLDGEELRSRRSATGRTREIPAEQLTCRFWFREACTKPGCRFAHSRKDFVVPKIHRECSFWTTGHCQWTDAECQYYHCQFDHEGNPLRQRQFRTCEAWKTGHCLLRDGECSAFHVYFEQDKALRTVHYTAMTASHDLKSPKIHESSAELVAEDQEPLFEPTYVTLTIQQSQREPLRATAAVMYDSGSSVDFLGKEIKVTSFCIASDVRAYFPHAVDGRHGSLTVVSGAKDDQLTPEQLSNHLYNTGSCGMGEVDEDHTVLLYPAEDTTWDFMSRSSSGVNASLRFTIMRGKVPRIPAQGANPPRQDIGFLLGLDIDWLVRNDNPNRTGRNVFLMFPQNYEVDMHLFTQVLLAQGATVFLPNIPGSWKQFYNESTKRANPPSVAPQGGVILWHPAVANFFLIPDVYVYLHRTSFSHYQIQARPDGEHGYEYTQVFPPAKALFLTDELFEEEPEKAMNIVRNFHHDTFQLSPASRKDRMWLRPGFLDYINKLGRSTQARKKSERLPWYGAIAKWTLEMVLPWSRERDCQAASTDLEEPIASFVSMNQLAETFDPASSSPKITEQLVQAFVRSTMEMISETGRFYVIMPSKKNDDGSDSEADGQILAPRSPFTPRTPGPEGKQAVTDESGRLKKWQRRYAHVRFLTAETYLAETTKKRRPEAGK